MGIASLACWPEGDHMTKEERMEQVNAAQAVEMDLRKERRELDAALRDIALDRIPSPTTEVQVKAKQLLDDKVKVMREAKEKAKENKT